MRPSTLDLQREPAPTADTMVQPAQGHETTMQGHIEEKNVAVAAAVEATAAAAAANNAAEQMETRLQEALEQNQALGTELGDTKAVLERTQAELLSKTEALAAAQADVTAKDDALAAAQKELAALKASIDEKNAAAAEAAENDENK